MATKEQLMGESKEHLIERLKIVTNANLIITIICIVLLLTLAFTVWVGGMG